MRGRRRLEAAAERGALQRRDERDVAARHRLEIAVAVERERQPLGAAGLPVLRRPAQVEAGAEIVAVAEDDPALRLFAGALDCRAQLLHHGGIEAVALVRAIEADEGDLAVELVGDRLFLAHAVLLVQRARSSPRWAMTLRWISFVPPPIMPMMAWRSTCSIWPTGAVWSCASVIA